MYIVILLVVAIFAGVIWGARAPEKYLKALPGARVILYASGTPFGIAMVMSYFFALNPILAQIIMWTGPVAALAAGLVMGGNIGRKTFAKKSGGVPV